MSKPKSKFVKGIFTMEDDEYFTKGGFSNSSIRLLKESALHHENGHLFNLEGMTFTFGSALHCMVLEPDEFDLRYAVESFEGDTLNKNSNAYKEAKKEWLKTTEGKEVLSILDHKKLIRMSNNVLTIAGSLLTGGQTEIALMTPLNGIQCKGKADYINHEMRLIIDVKTTASIKDFDKSVYDYNYHSQLALYCDMMKEISGKDYRGIIVMVEVNQPHMVRVAELDLPSMELGRELYTDMINKLKLWETDKVADVLKTTGVPRWVKRMHGYEVD